MFSLPTKKAMATALAGAAIASSLGASAASAAPVRDAAGTPCPAPPPSLIAASAKEEYTRWRAACASLASTTQPVAEESATTHDQAHATPPAVPRAASSEGFDVPSAAIGAAGTGLIVVLAAGGLAWRRPPVRRHRNASV